MEYEQDLKALQGFIDETNESLEDIEAAFIQLETDPSDLDIINKIFRPVHSMKGNSGFFGL
ncbi:MAG: Hpt domain-containing protein, partial [Desulfobulbaceae bacterium]|nr:Hpt domain-containing protein [Desulfobulbaceae bacterium]